MCLTELIVHECSKLLVSREKTEESRSALQIFEQLRYYILHLAAKLLTPRLRAFFKKLSNTQLVRFLVLWNSECQYLAQEIQALVSVLIQLDLALSLRLFLQVHLLALLFTHKSRVS